VMHYELDPVLFTSIRPRALIERLNQCDQFIKEEAKDK
jgi:hypothetical protein